MVDQPQVVAFICGYAADKKSRVRECAQLVEPFFRRHGATGGVAVYAEDGQHEPPTKAAILRALSALVRAASPNRKQYIVAVGCTGDAASAYLPSDFRTAGYVTHADVATALAPLPSTHELLVVADLVDGGSFVNLPSRLSAEKSAPNGSEPPRMLLRLDSPSPPSQAASNVTAVSTSKGEKLPATVGTFFKAFVAILDLNPAPQKQQLLADLWHVLAKSCGAEGPMPRLSSSGDVVAMKTFRIGGTAPSQGKRSPTSPMLSPSRRQPTAPVVQPPPVIQPPPVLPTGSPPTAAQPPPRRTGPRDGLQAFASQHMPPVRPSPRDGAQQSPRAAAPSPTTVLPQPRSRPGSRGAGVLRVPEQGVPPSREALEPLQGVWLTSSSTEVAVEGAQALFVESGHAFPLVEGQGGRIELMDSVLLGDPQGRPVRLVWDDGDVWARKGVPVPSMSPASSPVRVAQPRPAGRTAQQRLKALPILLDTVLGVLSKRASQELVRRHYDRWTVFVLLARQFRRIVNIGYALEGQWRARFAGQFFRKWRLWLVLRRPTTLPYRFRPVKSKRVGDPDRVALWIRKAVAARETDGASAAPLYDALRSVPSDGFWAELQEEYARQFAGHGLEEHLRKAYSPQELAQCAAILQSSGVIMFPVPGSTPPTQGL
eukprot:TRINITY_DN14494_c0_g1_i1.p1 TRINITY_DN14494_c0_g1~~TRINITY_DN14494_c0_g1_i1.p1  ORF type:complete len:656 (+),score=148.23 TRINITY_DN14494_c0_g1_i1:158-2125(+)